MKDTIRIKIVDLKCFILLLPVFRPMCMSFFSITKSLYSYLTFAIFIYLMLQLISRKKAPSIVTMTVFFLELWTFLITLFYKGSLNSVIGNLQTICIIAMIIDLYAEKITILLRSLMLHSEICVYINLVMILGWPNGFFHRTNTAYINGTQEWLLGVSNYFVIWLFSSLLIAWIYRYYFKKNRRCYMLTIAIVLTAILKPSGTGIVGLGILLFCIIFPKIRIILTPFKSIIIAFILIFIVVVVQQSDFLKPIIEGILGKDMTFSNRLLIWSNALSAITEKPLTGYGIMYQYDIISILGRMPGFLWGGATHTHCQILQILFQSGVIGFLLYITIYICSLRRCANYWKNRIAQIFTYSIFAFTIMSITEIFEYPLMYMILIIPFYIKKFVEKPAIKSKGEIYGNKQEKYY